MDWFWVLVFGGLAFWFHSQIKDMQGQVRALAGDNADLWARLREAERGVMERGGFSAPESVAPAPVEETPAPDETAAPEADPEPEAAVETEAQDIAAPAPKPEPQAPEPAMETAQAARAKSDFTTIGQTWTETEPASQWQDTEAEDSADTPRRSSFDFEDIFGRLLPIWGGGIALAIAGFFLVRWSIENGLLNEYVRTALGFAFGIGLIGAAEIAHRFNEKLTDPRVRQALSGAGIATLYASFYLAGAQYGLIGPAFAFAGMAGVTALAVLLSFRFGLPSAVLGLVGGFATPVLAGGSEPNLPILATYLALVTGGLTYTGEKQERPWLGIAALAGGLGWGLVMLVSGPVSDTDILAVGGYLVMVGTLLPSLMGQGAFGTLGRIVAAGVATLQIAALVSASGYALLAWGAYLLIAAALAVLGWRNHRMREAGAVAAGLAVCLLAAWPAPPMGWFWTIAATCTALFAVLPLAHMWREDAAMVDWGKLVVFPLALTGALALQFGFVPLETQDTALALVTLALALFPATAAWVRWPQKGETFTPASYGTLVSALALVWFAGIAALPAWSTPMVNAGVAALGWWLLRKNGEELVQAQTWVFALIGALLLIGTASFTELEQLIYYDPEHPLWRSALRWISAAAPFALLVMPKERTLPRRLAEVAATLLFYGAATMLVPAAWMPLALAIAVTALAWRASQRATSSGVLLALGAAWAILPIALWAEQATGALAGVPMLAEGLPTLSDLAIYVLPLLAALTAGFALKAKLLIRVPELTLMIMGLLTLVIAHTAYKGVFGLADLDSFIAYGLAERTLWQAALAGLGLVLARAPQAFEGQKLVGYVLGVCALLHFAWFSLVLHNPLLSEQAVGAWPLANLLLPAYGIAIGVLVWLRAAPQRLVHVARPAFDAAVMALVALLALSELRHAFAGTILIDPAVGSTEDLLRSLLAIMLALAYLAWGAWKEQRSWRIGSLVLMLGAVGKVFLFDTAGLEGLARIASFMALGMCLIGIGWFYTKQLKPADRAEA